MRMRLVVSTIRMNVIILGKLLLNYMYANFNGMASNLDFSISLNVYCEFFYV